MVKNAGLGLRWNRDYIAAAWDKIPEGLLKTDSEPLLALLDVLKECDERAVEDTQRTAEREARAMLGLWLDHMAHDFHVLTDLRTHAEADETSTSPAHLDDAGRERELVRYRQSDLQIRSYVTRVSGEVVRDAVVERTLQGLGWAAAFSGRWSRLKRVSGRWIAPALPLQSLLGRTVIASAPLLPMMWALHRRPAILFEMFHAICASRQSPFIRPTGLLPELKVFGKEQRMSSEDVSVYDSDGVVNTASMLWPYDTSRPESHQASLVESDHGDIIGHYRLRPLGRRNGGRLYQAYDIFPSDSGFDEARFSGVWQEIFEFAARL